MTSLLTTVLVTVAARDIWYISIHCTVTSQLTTVLVTVAARDIWYTSIHCTVTSLLTTALVTVAARDIWYTSIDCTVTSLLTTVLVTMGNAGHLLYHYSLYCSHHSSGEWSLLGYTALFLSPKLLIKTGDKISCDGPAGEIRKPSSVVKRSEAVSLTYLRWKGISIAVHLNSLVPIFD